ncbi:MAG: phenylalanine--tRNA ligase subunit alpha [Mycobacteriales bacterium]|nr:MAG: phenylalanine--tRNA ligase subunit alpha [Pseudonocardiales bacterium]
MPAANDPYDPKEVAALAPDALDAAVEAARRAFAGAADLEALAAIRPAHLGDRSPVRLAKREIGALPPQARADAGKRVNVALAALTDVYAERLRTLTRNRDEQVLDAERVDVTLPASRRAPGALHPLTAIQRRMCEIFVAMGYDVAEGPHIETTWFNFDALNTPPDHPSRSLSDTFWIEPPDAGLVLRTETSPVQIRTMLERRPPIYIVCPGTVFRPDELDATHTPVFHQIEGLAVDEGLSMAHLRGTLEHFARELFGADIAIRWRPHNFPFTEPSAEPDLRCFVCHGESVGNPDRPCRTCKSEGWIEWGGSGMVNPRVLRNCGIDPTVYSGFAFGMGIDRSLMFRSGIEDMHDMFEGDVRFSLSLRGEP